MPSFVNCNPVWVCLKENKYINSFNQNTIQVLTYSQRNTQLTSSEFTTTELIIILLTRIGEHFQRHYLWIDNEDSASQKFK